MYYFISFYLFESSNSGPYHRKFTSDTTILVINKRAQIKSKRMHTRKRIQYACITANEQGLIQKYAYTINAHKITHHHYIAAVIDVARIVRGTGYM